MDDSYRQRLSQINPLNTLAPNMQRELLERGDIRKLKAKEVLFQQGDSDGKAIYLLRGALKIHNKNRDRTQIVDADGNRARYAIGNLDPRPFTASANKAGTVILAVDREWLEGLVARSQMVSQESPAVTVTSFAGDKPIDGAWMFEMIQSPLFKNMPNAAIERLFASLDPVALEAGAVIIEQGTDADCYYMIAEGECEVFRDVNGMEFVIAELKSGEAFGEEGIIAGAPRGAGVRMKTDGTLMRLSADTFTDLLEEPNMHPCTEQELARALRGKNVMLVDVRMESEHGARSIRGSVNIPLYRLREQIDKLTGAQRVVTYCDTGARAEVAAFLLRERGFDSQYLKGGLASLKES